MEAARQNWLSERHEATATFDRLPTPAELTVFLPGDVLAIALGEETQEEEIRALLEGWDVTIDNQPDTHDRFVVAKRKKARK